MPGLRLASRWVVASAHRGRFRAAHSGSAEPRTAIDASGGVRLDRLRRTLRTALAVATEHQSRRAGLSPGQLLAWPCLACRQLAPLVVAYPIRRNRARGPNTPGEP